MELTDKLKNLILEAVKQTRKVEVTNNIGETFPFISMDEAGIYSFNDGKYVFIPWHAVTSITFPEGIESAESS
ncbi:MAG: hypothetical protein WCA07_09560 [Gloeobacterales cyanobacterium]